MRSVRSFFPSVKNRRISREKLGQVHKQKPQGSIKNIRRSKETSREHTLEVHEEMEDLAISPALNAFNLRSIDEKNEFAEDQEKTTSC